MGEPTWTKEGHQFRDALAATVPSAEVSVFRWRGGNLHRDRLHAATDLARRLAATKGEVLVVAHSHGGNVARMGLKMLDGDDCKGRINLLTLGTPFLNVRRFTPSTYGELHDKSFLDGLRDRRKPVNLPLLRWQNWTSLIYTLAIGLLLLASVHWSGVDYSGEPFQGAEANLTWEPLSGVWAEVASLGTRLMRPALVLGGVVAGVLFVLWRVGRLILKRDFPDGFDAPTIVEMLDTRDLEAHHDVIGVENDEAAWALNMGQLAGAVGATLGASVHQISMPGRIRANLMFWATLLLLLGFGFVVFNMEPTSDLADIGSIGGGLVVWGTATLLGGIADEMLTAAGFGLTAVALLGLVGMLVHTAEYLASGWDALALTSAARISVSPMAPGLHTTRLLDLEQDRLSTDLRHSAIYESKSAIEAAISHIARWHATLRS